MAKISKSEKRKIRHRRVRRKISGTKERPRMCVCTTGKHIYIQFIDDTAGHTLAATSTLDTAAKEADIDSSIEGAQKLGAIAAEKAKEAGISEVVYDRGGFNYHGRIKAIADAAREAGLKL